MICSLRARRIFTFWSCPSGPCWIAGIDCGGPCRPRRDYFPRRHSGWQTLWDGWNVRKNHWPCVLRRGPCGPHNRQIVDLDKAGRNSQGEVEFSSDFYLLRPKDIGKGNGAVLFEVANRGGKGILRLVNGGGPAAEFGDGFLLRQGFTVAWLGWQFDLADQEQNLRLTAPVAYDSGKTSTAWCAPTSRPR